MSPESIPPAHPAAPVPPPPAAGPSTSFVTQRPVAVLMMFLAAVVFGFFSYGRLPMALMPELSYPTLTVRTEYPGAAPEEVENDISRPIEEQLGVIGGLAKLSSVSRPEMSDVVLEFAWDTEMADATQDVLERLDSVFLPDGAERPLILHFDPELDPILELSLSGRGPAFAGEEGLRRLRRLADLLVKRELEPVKGVAAVRVKGGLEEEIHVLLEEQALERTGVSITQVIDRLSQENINLAGGTIQEGRTEYLVRTLNEFRDIEEIRNTIVTRIGERDVRVRDLGRVERLHKERQIITRTDGGESVQLEIYKEADANIVDLAKHIKAVIGTLSKEQIEGTAAAAPAVARGERGPRRSTGLAERLLSEEGAVLQVVADRSLFIESSIREVRDTAVIGGILAVLVLYPFLRNMVTTLIVALSIPVSLLVTFAPMHMLGVSLNIMSLGGLALGIGMLVDASIVVLESIHRAREEGDEFVAAAVRGTREVFGAVISTVLTTIAVFFPMVFVEGVAGQAFGDLGLAVTASLLASMVVALYLIPMLASRRGLNVARLERHDLRLRRFGAWQHLRATWRASRRRTRWMILPPLYWGLRFLLATVLEVLGKLLLLVFMAITGLIVRVITPASRRTMGVVAWLPLRVTDALLQRMLTGYPRLLRWSLAHRGLMFVIMGLTILGTVGLARTLDSELLPEVRQGEFTVEVALPVGTPLEQTERVLRPVEQAILAEKENIQSLILTLGYDPSQSERSDEGEHTARFKILLKRGSRVAHQEDQVSERLRARFEAVPDLKAQIVRPVLFSTRTPIEIEVHGEDMRALRDQAQRVQQVLSGLPELADVNTTLQAGAPEIQVVYDRERLTRYGLNVQDVARLVRDKVQGFEATRYNLRDRTIPIIVRLDEADRRAVENVEQLVVNPGAGPPIWLQSVADVVLGEGPSEVRRVDGQRVALVRANLAEGSLSGAVAAIRRELGTSVKWPSGMTYFISGQNEEWERSRGSLYLALWLSMFLVYVIMAIQFESLVQPFVIMFTIPMATIGTVVALKLLGIPVSVVVFLGVIMLVGIVVDNAIVLVDYLNQLRRRGLSIEEATIQAGTIRLRPILMTTLTTALGLLPMSLGFGDGAEIRTPMAISVIAGLISSTALTLLIIPTVYVAADGFVSRLLHARRARQGATGYEGAHAD